MPTIKSALYAGTAYFLVLFALGFALGTVRILIVAPAIGEFAAILAEVPIMISAAYFLCRWILRRWHIPNDRAIRAAMTGWFLILLASFETLFGALLFGRTVADQWSALGAPAGMLGLTAQIFAALLPMFKSQAKPV